MKVWFVVWCSCEIFFYQSAVLIFVRQVCNSFMTFKISWTHSVGILTYRFGFVASQFPPLVDSRARFAVAYLRWELNTGYCSLEALVAHRQRLISSKIHRLRCHWCSKAPHLHKRYTIFFCMKTSINFTQNESKFGSSQTLLMNLIDYLTNKKTFLWTLFKSPIFMFQQNKKRLFMESRTMVITTVNYSMKNDVHSAFEIAK